MKIADIQKFTILDFPDHLACTIFTLGCNFRCGFCHNPELVLPDLYKKQQKQISQKDFFSFLQSRKKVLEGVVITGGEPTIQKDLPEFMEKIKKEGFKVKLDTNGYCPEVLEKIIKMKVVDFIAMDVKSSLEKYEEITQVSISKEKILSSVNIIKKSSVDYEFRTTTFADLHTAKEIEKIGKIIKGAKSFALQNFRNAKLVDPEFKNKKGLSRKELNEAKEIMQKYVSQVEVRK